jgi:hypothetical protein
MQRLGLIGMFQMELLFTTLAVDLPKYILHLKSGLILGTQKIILGITVTLAHPVLAWLAVCKLLCALQFQSPDG